MGDSLPALQGIHNFRAVGPYALSGGRRLRPGMVFRSGAPERMTEADRAVLADSIGLRLIIDLRHPDEFEYGGREHPLSDRVTWLSPFPESTRQQDLIAELNGLYGAGPSPSRYLHYLLIGGERWARIFRLLAEPASYPLLVHCTAGKDRTGVLVGMLMELLGASDDDIAREYGLSDASLERLIDYLLASGRQLEGTREEIRERLATPPERMAGFIALLRERYGGAEPYLRSHGVNSDEISSIRQILSDGTVREP